MAVDAQPAAIEEDPGSARLRLARGARRVLAAESARLWPWSSLAAFLGSIVLWLLLGAVLYGTSRGLGWPARRDGGALLYLVAAVGLAPVWLLLLDALSRNRAVVEVRGLKLDFSSQAAAAPDVTLELNLLPFQAPLTDSSRGMIETELAKAAGSDTAVVDLSLGAGWWNTRLLALALGAEERGAPRRIVVLGAGGSAGACLGWLEPRELARGLLDADPQLREAWEEAEANGTLVELARANVPLARLRTPAVAPYAPPAYPGCSSAELRRLVLYDRLGMLERMLPRLRLDPPQLVALAGTSLHTEQLDRTWSTRRQVRTILEATATHVALVNAGVYERLLDVAELRASILRRLVLRDD